MRKVKTTCIAACTALGLLVAAAVQPQTGVQVSDAEAASITGGTLCDYFGQGTCSNAHGCPGNTTNYGDGDNFGALEGVDCGTTDRCDTFYQSNGNCLGG